MNYKTLLLFALIASVLLSGCLSSTSELNVPDKYYGYQCRDQGFENNLNIHGTQYCYNGTLTNETIDDWQIKDWIFNKMTVTYGGKQITAKTDLGYVFEKVPELLQDYAKENGYVYCFMGGRTVICQNQPLVKEKADVDKSRRKYTDRITIYVHLGS